MKFLLFLIGFLSSIYAFGQSIETKSGILYTSIKGCLLEQFFIETNEKDLIVFAQKHSGENEKLLMNIYPLDQLFGSDVGEEKSSESGDLHWAYLNNQTFKTRVSPYHTNQSNRYGVLHIKSGGKIYAIKFQLKNHLGIAR